MNRDITKLDKAFESRIRLGILSVLMVNEKVEFSQLKEMLELTDGNLASHITALEKIKYVEVTKQFIGKKPNTTYAATELGRNAFKDHLNALEALIKSHK